MKVCRQRRLGAQETVGFIHRHMRKKCIGGWGSEEGDICVREWLFFSPKGNTVVILSLMLVESVYPLCPGWPGEWEEAI